MADPMKVTVTIVLQPAKSPPFQMKSSLLQGKDLTFANNKFPGFSVNFVLEDPVNSGYLFPSDPKNAFAAKMTDDPNNSCPQQGEAWSELVPESVSNDFKTLTVRNYNSYPANFGFSLFVTKNPTGTGPYLMLDPIGSNHNGPRGNFPRNLVSIAIGIAAIIVIAFALVEFGVFNS
jgi:hypothetical protein